MMKKTNTKKNNNRRIKSVMMTIVVLLAVQPLSAESWKKLKDDRLHDPEAPALEVLQEPTEALSVLPPGGSAGNKVDWAKALRDDYIQPRAQIDKDAKLEQLDTNILFKETGDQPYVLFPHKTHTEWLECSNCHEKIFKTKAGETPVTMLGILSGEYCGVCHGAVAFPLTDCIRCHSVPIDQAGKFQ